MRVFGNLAVIRVLRPPTVKAPAKRLNYGATLTRSNSGSEALALLGSVVAPTGGRRAMGEEA